MSSNSHHPPKFTSGEWRALRSEGIRTAHRLGADDADAEDLAQEVVARLLTRLSRVSDKLAYVRRATRNLLLHQLKRRAVRARTQVRAARERREARSPTGEWRAAVDVGRILPTLPTRARGLLDLVRRGYTHAEIAAELGCETHQVGPRIRRAMRTARRRAARDRPRRPRPRPRPAGLA